MKLNLLLSFLLTLAGCASGPSASQQAMTALYNQEMQVVNEERAKIDATQDPALKMAYTQHLIEYEEACGRDWETLGKEMDMINIESSLEDIANSLSPNPILNGRALYHQGY